EGGTAATPLAAGLGGDSRECHDVGFESEIGLPPEGVRPAAAGHAGPADRRAEFEGRQILGGGSGGGRRVAGREPAGTVADGAEGRDERPAGRGGRGRPAAGRAAGDLELPAAGQAGRGGGGCVSRGGPGAGRRPGRPGRRRAWFRKRSQEPPPRTPGE